MTFGVFKTHPTIGPGIADNASEAQSPPGMLHLSEAFLQNNIRSKAPNTLNSAVIDVSNDHDGGEELQPQTKNRKEEKAKDKQKLLVLSVLR